MKIHITLVALGALQCVNAFAPKVSNSPISPIVLNGLQSDIDMFPPGTFPPLEVIQGGTTLRTWKMPPGCDRVQMYLTTNGRPLKTTVQLWLGPVRNTHTLELDMHNGQETPYRATLKFKMGDSAGPQTLTMRTGPSPEIPLLAAVSVPSKERAAELLDNTIKVWETCPPESKLVIQGGSTTGGGGAIRSWEIPSNVESVQIVSWSRDTSKFSFKAKVEVLQGPNTKRQEFLLQCGGGSQPYHAVISTPGDGWRIRIQNKKFVEDGKFEFAVVPYEVIGDAPARIIGGDVTSQSRLPKTLSGYRQAGPSQKQWWE